MAIRSEMVEPLEDAGYQVLEAANGLEAIRMLYMPDDVDIVVTDISMPEMDGIAVAEHVHEIHPNAPVIFASAWADRSALPEPSFKLAAPYTSAQLVALVRAVLMLWAAALPDSNFMPLCGFLWGCVRGPRMCGRRRRSWCS